jgi:hypothetical protein
MEFLDYLVSKLNLFIKDWFNMQKLLDHLFDYNTN